MAKKKQETVKPDDVLALWLVALAVAVIVIGFSVGNGLFSEATSAPTTQPASTTLEVRDAIDIPRPLDQQLQGADGTLQQSGSDLQQPQTSDELQPNARLRNIPESGLAN